jgi:hypothetical protein
MSKPQWIHSGQTSRGAMTRLFPSATPPQESSSASYPLPPHRPPRPPLPHLGLPRTQWGVGPQVEPLVAPPAALGWHMPTWGEVDSEQMEHEPEPQWWGSRRPPSRSSSDSAHDDPDYDPSLYHYVQTRSSFQGGTTVNATAFVHDPLNTRHPLSTRPLLVGLDSYSDVTVASRDIEYTEEGLVDIVDGPCSFRTILALVATQPAHLPQKCLLLLGVPQLNELDIKLDTHRTARRLPLQSYDPTIDFSADTHLQCRMSEKDLLAWAEHHKDTPVGSTKYSHLDVVYSSATLALDELDQLRQASFRYKKVYDAAKGALPALTNHPPVRSTLNFIEGWKHVSVPVPKWGPGATAILTRWAKQMIDSGLYNMSKSPSASRPHIVRKTPPDAPKDIDITQCDIRVCGDYRMPNDQPIAKVLPYHGQWH